VRPAETTLCAGQRCKGQDRLVQRYRKCRAVADRRVRDPSSNRPSSHAPFSAQMDRALDPARSFRMTEPASHAPPLLRELLVFCAIAGVLILLARRLHFSQMPAFLLADVAISPYGRGAFAGPSAVLARSRVTDLQRTQAIAEFGVAFLFVTLDLELSSD
jgi:hypothetical protein